MIDKTLKSLIDAPLADPLKLAIHGEPRKITRGPRDKGNENMPAAITRKEVQERKEKALGKKIDALLDYYATTDLPAERIAEHCGLYRQVQTGVDEKTQKPIFARVLDVDRARQELQWRKARAA